MCGIAGIFHIDGAEADAGALRRMTRIIEHRGPDGEGLHVEGPVGLGHRRLSIIDLSEKASQPMTNEDRSVWITFNGEIYNHEEIRRDLVARGHVFNSRCDTEAIVHGYEEYGQDIATRLNGMFAYAIWDGKNQRLTLTRDRIGIKPLFFALFGDTFLFGSESKAILEHPAAERSLDHEALDLFLSLNYVPAPMTMLRGIRQVEPGQTITITRGSRDLASKIYWDIDCGATTDLPPAAVRDRFAELLDTAVQRRLMSDVPLGVFLSGGVDSSAVVACMTAHRPPESVESFSMGFDQRAFNEAPYARLVAEHLGTKHRDKIVTPELAAVIPKVVWHGEDVVADSSMIPSYYLSQMTREHVTVALAGDGADEILAGYPTYIATQWARRLQFVPRGLARGLLQPALDLLPVSDQKISRSERFQRFARGVGLSWQDAHAVWREIHTTDQKRAILAGGNGHGQRGLFEAYRKHYRRCETGRLLNRLLYVDTRFYLPNDMLAKVDRMSMAHSLEARVPFMDHELVEFVAGLPEEYKLKGGVGKLVLREIMADRLPPKTLSRRKEGFNVPVAGWLRGDLSELLQDNLSESRLKAMQIWRVDGVQKMVTDHIRRRRDYGHQLWGLLSFSLWWQQFIEGHTLSVD